MRATAEQDRWWWVAGAAAVAFGLAAHLVSGGIVPTLPVLLAMAALSALAAELTGRWIHGPVVLLLVSGLAQQLLFFGFDALGGSFPGGGTSTHSHGPQQIPPQVPAGENAGPAAHTGDVMLYTHAAAAILTLLVGAGVARLVRATSRSQSGAVATGGPDNHRHTL